MFKVGDLVIVTLEGSEPKCNGLGFLVKIDWHGHPNYFVHTRLGYGVWCYESELSKPNEK